MVGRTAFASLLVCVVSLGLAGQALALLYLTAVDALGQRSTRKLKLTVKP